jgi:hypothetical protein
LCCCIVCHELIVGWVISQSVQVKLRIKVDRKTAHILNAGKDVSFSSNYIFALAHLCNTTAVVFCTDFARFVGVAN